MLQQWEPLFLQESKQPYFQSLLSFLDDAYNKKSIYPPKEGLFRALELTAPQATKVVILGQDPYHQENQAHGLAFSVNCGIKFPPTLRNIFKEYSTDLSLPFPTNGDLTPWATQGVLLLNRVLSVEANRANSHQNRGWETFTSHIIRYLSDRSDFIVFILWGNAAKQSMKDIDTNKHAVITSAHPSPLSAYRGFFGSKPFSRTNSLLHSHHKESINWQL